MLGQQIGLKKVGDAFHSKQRDSETSIDTDRPKQPLRRGWGALVKGSDPPDIGKQCSHDGRSCVAGAGQLSGKSVWPLVCRKQTAKILDSSPMAKKDRFCVGEVQTARAISRPLDHGSTLYLRGHHLHSRASPDTKRVGRGLTARRDRRCMVACAVSYQRVVNFQRESTNCTSRSRVNKRNKRSASISPVFSHGCTIISGLFVLINGLEAYLCNIMLSLASVYAQFIFISIQQTAETLCENIVALLRRISSSRDTTMEVTNISILHYSQCLYLLYEKNHEGYENTSPLVSSCVRSSQLSSGTKRRPNVDTSLSDRALVARPKP